MNLHVVNLKQVSKSARLSAKSGRITFCDPLLNSDLYQMKNDLTSGINLQGRCGHFENIKYSG